MDLTGAVRSEEVCRACGTVIRTASQVHCTACGTRTPNAVDGGVEQERRTRLVSTLLLQRTQFRVLILLILVFSAALAFAYLGLLSFLYAVPYWMKRDAMRYWSG